MSDLAQWDVRGPVRTLRAQHAEWNPEAGDWWPLKTRTVVIFRADGRLSEIHHHNPDGSVPRQVWVYDDDGRLIEDQSWDNEVMAMRVLHTYDSAGRAASLVRVDADGTRRETERCSYDETGRKTKVVFLTEPDEGAASCSTFSCGTFYGVEGTDAAYSAPGATTSTITHDERELPSEVSFRDANDALISRVVFSRDLDGRLLSERMQFERTAFFAPPTDVVVPSDERESLDQLLTTAFEDQTFSLTTYAYDEKGRRIETLRRMGQLSEERTICGYDDHDNPVEQLTVDRSREMRIEDGAVTIEEKPPLSRRVRFEYRYDEYGNWIERVVWVRTDPNPEDRRSNIERRTITYYGG
jgi:YD repeat-containing protein